MKGLTVFMVWFVPQLFMLIMKICDQPVSWVAVVVAPFLIVCAWVFLYITYAFYESNGR